MLVFLLIGFFKPLLAQEAFPAVKDSLEVYQKKAKEENKKLLIFFTAKWCAPCLKLKKGTFEEPAVEAIVEARYLWIEADIDTPFGDKLIRHFNLKGGGIPVLLIYEEDKILALHNGYLTPSQAVSFLEKDYHKEQETVRIYKNVLDYQWFKGVLVGYALTQAQTPSHWQPQWTSSFQAGLLLNYHWRANKTFSIHFLYQRRNLKFDENYILNRNFATLDVQYNHPLFVYGGACKSPFWFNFALYGGYSFADKLQNAENAPFSLEALQKWDAGARLGFSASMGTFEPSFGYEQGFLNLSPQNSSVLHRQFYATLKVMIGK